MRTSHTLRRPGLGEVYATLVNTALNALRLEGWFPSGCPCPCEPRPAHSAQCRPSLASAVKPPDFAIVLTGHRPVLAYSYDLG